MKPILTPQQMNHADGTAIKRLRIPSAILMEQAGTAVADLIGNIITPMDPSGNRSLNVNVLILCGKGNNGGDGFVISRILKERGYDVSTVLMEHQRTLGPDAAVQYGCLAELLPKTNILRFGRSFTSSRKKHFDVIVDAMLGTSFRGALKGKYLRAVEWCNKRSALKIAVDIPTGLNGLTGDVETDAFRADYTVTMSNPKIGFYCGQAKEFTGIVTVADIGIPQKAVPKTNVVLAETNDIRRSLPKRAVNSHKHSVGKIFALAGSKSMMGAALLCSSSAMRSGAGQVILGIPESEYLVAAKRTLEVMPLPLPSTFEGSLAYDAFAEIEKRIAWCDVLMIGCGLSRNAETQELIRRVIQSCRKPMVIDADALNALSGHLDIIKGRRHKNIILTPHLGEFSRLTGIPSSEIDKNRFTIAAQFSKKYGVTLVLKGAPSIVADTQGNITVNSTGNPGMSTAGSGDVLTGIVASLMGQGNDPADAAVNGVFIHGAAGDRAAEKIGMQGMIASDMIEFIPTVIRKVLL
ncbi:MAG: NAD(P)H-hydrate dehydratase [Bacteroidota bacterium]